LAAIYLPLALNALAIAEDPPPPTKVPVVLARVQAREITAAEVEFEAAAALERFPLEESLRQRLRDHWVELLIERELVLSYLERTGAAASAGDVDLTLRRFAKQLESQDGSLPKHLASLGLSEAQFRRSLLWKLSWRSYVERYTTPTHLERFFEKQRPHFDGGKRRVAQIFWKLEATAGEPEREETLAKASAVRQELAENKLTFAEAARKHSQSPTAAQGGDIGWIERRGSMPETFSLTAFELTAGGVSGPVESPAGVHLIQCLEIQPGKRNWREAAEELRPAAANYLFRWIADKERPQAVISKP
jgi:hypothetical protein